MTRNRWLVVAVAVVVAAGLAAVWAVSASQDGSARHERTIGDERAAATTTPPRDPGPPYAVGIVRVTLVDTSRARCGPRPHARVTRTVAAGDGPVSNRGGGPIERRGVSRRGRHRRSTLRSVLFAHGFALTDQTYPRFLHDLAAAGFVVADPEFPLSSSALPGPASDDVVEQARDLGFVADRLLDGATRPAPLLPVVFGEKLGVVGHSDGGVTAVGFAANSCCADSRVGAAVILSGALGRFPGAWFTTAAPPVLVLHGDADEVNPLSSSEGVYAAARAPEAVRRRQRWAAISAPSRTTPTGLRSSPLVADFLRAHVLGDNAAAARLAGDADVPGVLASPRWRVRASARYALAV